MANPKLAGGPIWVVRAGKSGHLVDDFRSEGYVALGCHEAGAIDKGTPDDQIDALFAKVYPHAKPKARAVHAAQVKRFLREVAIGDAVCTYDPGQRVYLLGAVASDATFKDGPSGGGTM